MNLSYWTQSRNREQLQRIHQSHFEQEDADIKWFPLALMMVNETYFKLHIKIKTKTKNYQTIEDKDQGARKFN